MSVESALARGRAAHARLMTDTVTIERRNAHVWNPTTGEYGDTWTTVYTGPADVKPANQRARGVDASETETAIGAYDVKIPADTAVSVKVEDRVTPTASGDSRLVNRVLFVQAVGLGSRRTAWHITATDQEQP